MNQNSAEVQQLQAQIEQSQQTEPRLDEATTCHTIISLLDSLMDECGDGDEDLRVKLQEAKNVLDT